MDPIKFAITKPVTVCVSILLLILFGLIGVQRLPVLLTPDVETPQITVSTTWPGATPYEVEKDIIEPQEDVLKGIQNLTMLESSSYNNQGQVTLTFEVGVNLNDALLRVSNKLNEVRSYPENVQKPVIEAAGAQSSPVIWMVLKTIQGDPEIINTYRTFFDNEVRQYIDRVPGVGSLFVFGGTPQQLEILISPQKMARYGLTIGELIQRLQSANIDVPAGVLGLEKSNYRIRMTAQFQAVADPLDVLLVDDGHRRVFLRDVAETRLGYAESDVAVMHNAVPDITVGVRREQGANVLELTERMYKVVAELNAGLLRDNNLEMTIVYDQTGYIGTAIRLVQRNVVIGGLLALGVLLLFLRNISATLATSVAIPISVIGTFIFLWAFNRSINVVSLAGISFAVGMLVDNAIVVLENIDRHRQEGKNAFKASYDGAKEVWGAVLASTATTVAVFLPVIFIQEEAGQLFKDIAIAITFAIIISLMVSIAGIPTITHLLYRWTGKPRRKRDPIGRLGGYLAAALLFFSRLTLKSRLTRLSTVLLLTGGAALVAFSLIPRAEYLPQGNSNLILNILIPPPGYSLEKREAIGRYIFQAADPYFKEDFKDGIPRLENIFFVSADQITLFGVISAHETRVRETMPLLNRIIQSIPGIFGISLQTGIFETGLGRGRTVSVNISGDRIERILEAGRMLYGSVQQALPEAQIRPVPSLENTFPEVNFIPDRSRLLANGLTEQDLGAYIDVVMQGRKIGEYKPQGVSKMDLVLRSREIDIQTPEDIADSLMATRFGSVVRIRDVARMEYGQGMIQIDHLERQRNIRLEVTPPLDIPLQHAMEIIEQNVLADLRAKGLLRDVTVSLGGSADKLTAAIQAIQWNLIIAAIIVYLLMSALFENFFYPLIIMFAVPLAAAGGFAGLYLVNRLVASQPFDVVTMLGFIILVGTVVNNAILIVYQALNNVRYYDLEGMEAIRESVRTRIRPIFMSTTTSLFGMLPLVLSTGAGSELYRGVGSVILGGLAVSALFTLFVIPALLSFFIGFERRRTHDV